MDYEKLEEVARKCVESDIAEIKDTTALTVVEVADENLSDAEVDTVLAYCSKFAGALQKALNRASVR